MTPIFYPSETQSASIHINSMHERLNIELSRVVHAAIINRRFRENLLADPVRSIEAGFCGESFYIPRETKDQIRQIKAGSLEEFASAIQSIWSLQPASEMAIRN